MKILIICLVTISTLLINSGMVKAEEKIISYPVTLDPELIKPLINSYNFEKSNPKPKFQDSILASLGTGVMDNEKKLYFYTAKDLDSWGAEESIYVYSIVEKKVIREIPFDNSGYYKYPISISPDSKKIVIAERSHSVGEVNILVIETNTGKTVISFTNTYAPAALWLDNESIVTLSPRMKCKNQRLCSIEGVNLRTSDLKRKKDKVHEVPRVRGESLQLDILELREGKISIGSKLKGSQIQENKVEINVNLLKNE